MSAVLKSDAMQICEANLAGAQAKKLALRAQFPLCAEFIESLQAEGLRPRVCLMREIDLDWIRPGYVAVGEGVRPVLQIPIEPKKGRGK